MSIKEFLYRMETLNQKENNDEVDDTDDRYPPMLAFDINNNDKNNKDISQEDSQEDSSDNNNKSIISSNTIGSIETLELNDEVSSLDIDNSFLFYGEYLRL